MRATAPIAATIATENAAGITPTPAAANRDRRGRIQPEITPPGDDPRDATEVDTTNPPRGSTSTGGGLGPRATPPAREMGRRRGRVRSWGRVRRARAAAVRSGMAAPAAPKPRAVPSATAPAPAAAADVRRAGVSAAAARVRGPVPPAAALAAVVRLAAASRGRLRRRDAAAVPLLIVRRRRDRRRRFSTGERRFGVLFGLRRL